MPSYNAVRRPRAPTPISMNRQDYEGCGFLLASLCVEGEAGCVQDVDGGYDVVLPEPLGGKSGNGYRIRIAEVGGGWENVRCSDDFYLMASVDKPIAGEVGGPSIAVLSPTKHSVAFAGGEYTIEVSIFVGRLRRKAHV